MKLSKRLKAISKLVNSGSIVADIGTDHGYLPVYLVKKKIVPRAIASDVSKKSLQKAIDYIGKLDLESKIETRLGSGLEVLSEGEVDTVIISGMGAILIIDILRAAPELTKSIDNFIFQPMLASDKLREYLISHKFDIIDERIVKEDGKFYEVIKAVHSDKINNVEDEIYFEISKKLLLEQDPLLKEFIEEKIKYNESIISVIEDKHSFKVSDRLEDLENKNKRYREVLHFYESN